MAVRGRLARVTGRPEERTSPRRFRSAPRQPRVRAALLIIAAAGTSSCGLISGPDPDVRVHVASAHFKAGENIRFEIRNDLTTSIRFGVCANRHVAIRLLRRVRGDWQDVAGGQCGGFGDFGLWLLAGDRREGIRSGTNPEGLYALSFDYVELVENTRFVIRNRLSKPFQITE